MPIRMLRDWTDSEPINDLDFAAEVLFVRLIMKADDYGRFTANPKLIRALCFPLKDGIRESDISRQIAACVKAGLIALYQVDSKPYLEIVKFGQRLRNSRKKYPDPPEVAASCGELPEVAGSDGLNGNRNRIETETELEPDGNGVSKFRLWENATAKELGTPAGAQKLFEAVMAANLCTVDERHFVFRLVLSLKDDKKIRNLPAALTSILRGDAGKDPWRARGGDFDDQAREWQRSLDVPPEMQQRTSDLSTGPPSASIIDDHKRKLLEFEQKRKEVKT